MANESRYMVFIPTEEILASAIQERVRESTGMHGEIEHLISAYKAVFSDTWAVTWYFATEDQATLAAKHLERDGWQVHVEEP